jgi:hypothetical protein
MRRKRYGFVSEKYLNLRATMGKGGPLSPSTTPREIINKSARLQVGDEVREFIRLYEGHRFGGKQMNPEDRKRYGLLLRTIKKGLKRRSF